MRYIFLLLSFIFCTTLSAQTLLQLEKYGNINKTRKYYIGENIIYQLKGDPTWYTMPIERIIPSDTLLVFKNRYVKLYDIKAIKSFHNKGWSQKMGTSVSFFGLAWSVFALGGSIADEAFSYRKADAIVTATAITTGYLLRWAFKSKKYRMGKKYRLRVLDIPTRPF